MPDSFRSYIKFLIAACLVLSFCMVNVEAQTRRKKRPRRTRKPAAERPVITNPPIAPPATTPQNPSTGYVNVISTADSTTAKSAQTHEPKKETPSPTTQQA